MTDQNPDTAPTTEQIFAAYAEYERRRAALLPANKAALFAVLARSAVTQVVVTFDGTGDSGQIDTITAMTGDKECPLPADQVSFLHLVASATEPEPQPLSIERAIETLAYQYLEGAQPGWENNDGAFGEFQFDVATQIVTLDFNGRYTSYDASQHVF
jgi:hypothetical protein